MPIFPACILLPNPSASSWPERRRAHWGDACPHLHLQLNITPNYFPAGAGPQGQEHRNSGEWFCSQMHWRMSSSFTPHSEITFWSRCKKPSRVHLSEAWGRKDSNQRLIPPSSFPLVGSPAARVRKDISFGVIVWAPWPSRKWMLLKCLVGRSLKPPWALSEGGQGEPQIMPGGSGFAQSAFPWWLRAGGGFHSGFFYFPVLQSGTGELTLSSSCLFHLSFLICETRVFISEAWGNDSRLLCLNQESFILLQNEGRKKERKTLQNWPLASKLNNLAEVREMSQWVRGLATHAWRRALKFCALLPRITFCWC